MATTTPTTEAAIWERIINPKGPMSPETAKHMVDLSIPGDEAAKLRELAEKNRAGLLTPTEAADLDNYCRVGTLLSVLKSRARQVLKQPRRTS